MFSFILWVVGSLMHLYVSWHAAGLAPGRRRQVVFVSAGLWLLYGTGVAIGDDAQGALAWWLAQFAFHWLGTLFILSLALLPVDGVSLAGRRSRRVRGYLRRGALALGGGVVALALVQGMRAPEVTHYRVNLAGLPPEVAGLKVVALSDLHLGATLGPDWLAARVAQVNALEPDLVVLIGDLSEGGTASMAGLPGVLARLQAPLGVWAVTGNHEFHGDTRRTIDAFARGGVRWLRDERATLAPGFHLVGVDHRHRGEPGVAPTSLVGEGDGTTLVLSHAPEGVARFAAAGADLMLSGHTHHGQIWPFGYLVRQRYPYFAGHYRAGGLQVIVGRGAGTWGPRMRLWRPGEILVITLHRATAGAPPP